MSLRSKVVIESNLKPSQFGKPAIGGSNPGSAADKEDDFDEVYEDPLEKSKPLPPRLPNIGSAQQLQELPRNEPEIMEFSNAVGKNNRDSNLHGDNISSNRNSGVNRDEKIVTLDIDKPGCYGDNAMRNLHRNSKDEKKGGLNQHGFTNEGFSDESIQQKLIDHSNSSHERIVHIESQEIRNSQTSQNNNGKNQLPLEDNTDISFRGVINAIKSLDVNRYATKKTIAQGMLDIALLTANASQLKYILQVGKQHEFYILMLSLIGVSIGLQVIQGVICVLLGSSLNINKQQDQRKANIWNNICLILMVLTVAVNAVISAFDMRDNSALTATNVTKGASVARLPSGGR